MHITLFSGMKTKIAHYFQVIITECSLHNPCYFLISLLSPWVPFLCLALPCLEGGCLPLSLTYPLSFSLFLQCSLYLLPLPSSSCYAWSDGSIYLMVKGHENTNIESTSIYCYHHPTTHNAIINQKKSLVPCSSTHVLNNHCMTMQWCYCAPELINILQGSSKIVGF